MNISERIRLVVLFVDHWLLLCFLLGAGQVELSGPHGFRSQELGDNAFWKHFLAMLDSNLVPGVSILGSIRQKPLILPERFLCTILLEHEGSDGSGVVVKDRKGDI